MQAARLRPYGVFSGEPRGGGCVDPVTPQRRLCGGQHQPQVTGDGYYEGCVAGPEGLLVELTV